MQKFLNATATAAITLMFIGCALFPFSIKYSFPTDCLALGGILIIFYGFASLLTLKSK